MYAPVRQRVVQKCTSSVNGCASRLAMMSKLHSAWPRLAGDQGHTPAPRGAPAVRRRPPPCAPKPRAALPSFDADAKLGAGSQAASHAHCAGAAGSQSSASSLLHVARMACLALQTRRARCGAAAARRAGGRGRGRTSPVDRADLGERQPDALRVLGRRPLLQDVLALQGVDLRGPGRPSPPRRAGMRAPGATQRGAGCLDNGAWRACGVGCAACRASQQVTAWSCPWALARP